MRLSSRFPDFGEVFDGRKMRTFITHLEQLFARVKSDDSRAAYTLTSNTTLGQYDDVVLVDTSGGDVEITLPEISDNMIKEKREYEVVKSVTAGIVTITPTGTDTIVGEDSAIVTVRWTALRMRATTGNWILI